MAKSLRSKNKRKNRTILRENLSKPLDAKRQQIIAKVNNTLYDNWILLIIDFYIIFFILFINWYNKIWIIESSNNFG